MTEISMIGLDLAKNVFQVHGVDASGQVVLRRQLRRGQVERFFAQLPPCVVGMEACGAMQRPTMRFVPVKTEEQQGILALHRTRALLVRQRTMTSNALRAGLAEFGIVAAQGLKGLRKLMSELAAGQCAIPETARAALSLLAVHWEHLDGAVDKLEREIVRAVRSEATARRLIEIPTVGPIGASAVLAKVPDARVFGSARDFTAWIGLTPKQFGTGGKQRSGHISKQGDKTLRMLFVLGATSYLRQEIARGVKDPWLRDLLARRPFKVVAVALAAKTARIIWAMLITGERYRAPAATAA